MNVELLIQKSIDMKRANKGYLSNAFYTLPQWKEMEQKGVLSIHEGEGSIWVSIRENNIYRLVFFAESIECIQKMNFSVFDKYDMPLVLEFLDKKNQAENLMSVLESKSFHFLKCLHRMYCVKINFVETDDEAADYRCEIATTKDAQVIYDMLYEIFDVKVSRLPSLQDILDDIAEGHIFVVKKENSIGGVAYFQRQGMKVEYLYQLALREKYRGKNLAYPLLQYSIEALGADKNYSVWVEADNPVGIHIYKKIGFQEDGLKEYIFQYN